MSENSHEAKGITPPTETIACDVCMKEIPHSVAHSYEGPDYVLHFCGHGCYAQWRRDADDDTKA